MTFQHKILCSLRLARWRTLTFALLAAAALSHAPAKAQSPATLMPLGGNLESLTDWSTSWVFKDCFKLARTWMTRPVGSEIWDNDPPLSPPTNSQGWPLAVPFAANGTQQILHTMVPLYGPGQYTVRLRGTGRIELVAPNGGGIQTISASGGVITRLVNFSPTVTDNMLFLRVLESAGNDPLRNIEIISPGQDNNVESQPFHPEFLASLTPYQTLRFMDWLHINDSPLTSWADRTTRDAYTQTLPAGSAHEYIVALANQTDKDVWICIPHGANDDYVRETARLYRDSLEPDRVLYVEYSNETWNPQFLQTDYVQERGEAFGLDPARWTAGQMFVARRSGEIFGIFAQEFGTERNRFVAVLATQAANAGVSEERLAAMSSPAVNPSGQRPDALAIAPYFGVNYEPGVPVPTADQVVTSASIASITEARQWTREQRAVAEASNLRLVCYEGGQHFTGIFAAQNNEALISVLLEANRDARMQHRYTEYLQAMQDEGVDLFLHFNHISLWSRFGSWGALEYQQQPEADAPKWRAIRNWSTPGITSGPFQPGSAVGRSFSYTITANNSPTTFAATDLPSGLSVNTATGLIAGTPTRAGVFNFTVSANNPATGTVSTALRLTVAKGAQTISFRQAPTQKFKKGRKFTLTATASPSGLPVSFRSSNPKVLSISGGTATIRGKGMVTVTASQRGDANYLAARPVGRTITIR